MVEPSPDAVTLNTLHDDLRSGFTEMRGGFADLRTEIRGGFADLRATLVSGFRGLPARETSEEMVRLLREANRLQEERFAQLDLRTREQYLQTQQVLHAVVEGQRLLLEGQRSLVESQRDLSADIKALIARIDALIRGRGNGDRTA